jgi:hypothetical protein
MDWSFGRLFAMGHKNKKEEKREERKEVRAEVRQARALERIADLLEDFLFPVAKSLTVTIGDTKMGNTVLAVGKTAQATAHEWSGLAGSGTELLLAGAISWVSADPTVVTVDPASGLITAVAPSKLDTTGAPIPVDVTATDAANGLSNPIGDATITDVAPPPPKAQSLTVTVAPL